MEENIPQIRKASTWHTQVDDDSIKKTDTKERAAPAAKLGGGLFVDVEQMKDKLRDQMVKPQYDVSDFYVKEGIFQYIARHKVFEGATLSVIAFNALWISIDTDHNKAEMLLGAQPLFQIAEHFFCFYFSFEWFCRYKAFKRKRDGLKDAWFVFDSIMVFMMVAETWVMTAFLLATGAASGGGLGNASILRLARLLRLSRMARMARLLRAMPELLILIKGMVAAMRSVCFTLALLGILVYVFGIMFTQLTAETVVGELYFDTVPLAMHTLLLDGALLDGMGTVVKALGEESYVFAFIFYIFILLASLTMMNMLIGVLCEVVSAVATTEKEEITVSYVKEKLQEVVASTGLDEDGDGLISRTEFQQIIEIPDAVSTLTEVGIDVVALVDLSDFIFEGADGDEDEEKTLTFVDFLELVLQLRGSNTATVKDIVDLRKFVRTGNKILEERLEAIMMGNPRNSARVGTPKNNNLHSNGEQGNADSGEQRGRRNTAPGDFFVSNAVTNNGFSVSVSEATVSSQPDLGLIMANREGKSEYAQKSEEKIWLGAGKLEQLLLAMQNELEVMEGIVAYESLQQQHQHLLRRPMSFGELSGSSLSVISPTNPYTHQDEQWEMNDQNPYVAAYLPGVPDTAVPASPTVLRSAELFEDVKKQLGIIKQSLLESKGGILRIRTKLGMLTRVPEENGGRPETRRLPLVRAETEGASIKFS